MPSARMIPHTVTLFNYLGEFDGQAKYQKTILRNVQCDENFGATQALKGRNSDDSAALYIFDSKTVAESVEGYSTSYIPLDLWRKEELKELYWTLSEDDYFIPGESEIEDPRDELVKFKITHHHRYNMGSARMKHWEVYGR